MAMNGGVGGGLHNNVNCSDILLNLERQDDADEIRNNTIPVTGIVRRSGTCRRRLPEQSRFALVPAWKGRRRQGGPDGRN